MTNTDLIPVQSEVPMLDTGMFAQMQRAARAMAAGSLVPQHLIVKDSRGDVDETATAANCLRIINQAYRWQFDPFAVMDESFVIGGKLGFQGKLVLAAINTHANLSERLTYAYKGEGADRTIQVSGVFSGESKPKTVTVRVGDVRTKNAMWDKDPDQKLIYTGVVKWARAHCPEVIMGVVTVEDIEGMQERGELRKAVDGSYVPAERPVKPEPMTYEAAQEAKSGMVRQHVENVAARADQMVEDADAQPIPPQLDLGTWTLTCADGGQLGYTDATTYAQEALNELQKVPDDLKSGWVATNIETMQSALPEISLEEVAAELEQVIVGAE